MLQTIKITKKDWKNQFCKFTTQDGSKRSPPPGSHEKQFPAPDRIKENNSSKKSNSISISYFPQSRHFRAITDYIYSSGKLNQYAISTPIRPFLDLEALLQWIYTITILYVSHNIITHQSWWAYICNFVNYIHLSTWNYKFNQRKISVF